MDAVAVADDAEVWTRVRGCDLKDKFSSGSYPAGGERTAQTVGWVPVEGPVELTRLSFQR